MQKEIITVLILLLFLYLLWGIFHHKKTKSLTLLNFLEYLLTAGLALVLVTGVQF